MNTALPMWSLPLLLALLGIVLAVGHLGVVPGVIVSVETLLFCGYLIVRARRNVERPRPIANLLPLFPGHLLLLLAIASLEHPDPWALLWAVVPVATLGYDAIASATRFSGRRRVSILVGLYVIIWADLFVLLERIITLKRGSPRGEGMMIAVVLGAVGALFVGVGVYRHWIAAKE